MAISPDIGRCRYCKKMCYWSKIERVWKTLFHNDKVCRNDPFGHLIVEKLG